MRKDLELVSTKPWWITTSAGIFLGVLVLVAAPSYFDLSQTVWKEQEQSHGPVILALSLWLLWRKRDEVTLSGDPSFPFVGLLLLLFSGLAYAIGRSQAVVQIEILGVIAFFVTACILAFGIKSLHHLWFPLFLLLFTVPLPGVLVQTLTVPLKSAVSYVAELVLYHSGYPVARTGVILSVGQYQLLVADACAGLTSIFTLEAMGLAYIQLMNYQNKARNVALAILVIPCAFVANVARVIVLVLVTYHFGNDAGQGFIHSFAGVLLFLVALVNLLAVDRMLELCFSERERHPAAAQGAT